MPTSAASYKGSFSKSIRSYVHHQNPTLSFRIQSYSPAKSPLQSTTMPELTGDPNRHPISDFSEGISGHCLCGSIHVTIRDKELFTRRRGHLCHCANCRKVAGSYVAANLLIEDDKVTIEDRDGTLKEFVDTQTGSGEPLGRWFCSRCGK